MGATLTREREEALVLFEFLSREVGERHGARPATALVTPGEFWALNALHCLLERETWAPMDRPYAQAVREARTRLTPEETEIAVDCLGEDSPAMQARPLDHAAFACAHAAWSSCC